MNQQKKSFFIRTFSQIKIYSIYIFALHDTFNMNTYEHTNYKMDVLQSQTRPDSISSFTMMAQKWILRQNSRAAASRHVSP